MAIARKRTGHVTASYEPVCQRGEALRRRGGGRRRRDEMEEQRST